MADDDLLSDAQADIAGHITQVLESLLTRKTNPYNWPTWLQGALLLDRCVLPCPYYPPPKLLELAAQIITKSEAHEHQIELYQQKGSQKIPVQTLEISGEIGRIRTWIEKYME